MNKTNNFFFSGSDGNRLNSILIAVAVIVFLLSGVGLSLNYVWVQQQISYGDRYLLETSNIRSSAQLLPSNIENTVTQGTDASFEALSELRNDIIRSLALLSQGDATADIPAMPEGVSVAYQSLLNAWGESSVTDDESAISGVNVNINRVIDVRSDIRELFDITDSLNESIPYLQSSFEEVTRILVGSEDATALQIAISQRQVLLLERILRSISEIIRNDGNVSRALDALSRDSRSVAQSIEILQGTLPQMGLFIPVTNTVVLDILRELYDSYSVYYSFVDSIVEKSLYLFTAQEAVSRVSSGSADMVDSSQKILDDLQNLDEYYKTNTYISYGLIALMVLSIIAFGVLFIIRQQIEARQQQEQAREINERNIRNQDAILRLLDEIGGLADGDLTTHATVTEDFTGAIADSINLAIDQLRTLVTTINGTAIQVSAAAQETQETAQRLANASEHQAQEISGASVAINEIASSIEQVSSNAAQSTLVAESSVTIAKRGSEIVQKTIGGMDSIREQIQDTSKRIKRLGESSQEIGDIVGLINDIADQTNILALNAAIQASMAGDAGRGFAVVADEVQRLAERSAAATKQIETLVKTIQNDTNEAIVSMEQTTLEVVNGASLAQDAGVSLGEIERVSKDLADLIQSISNAARQQAASATHISNTMNVIQEITTQTSTGTTATARNIGNLTRMASVMRESVSGFSLPKTHESSILKPTEMVG